MRKNRFNNLKLVHILEIMKLKKDFFKKLLIYIFPIIIVIDIINRYLINNYMLYILNNIMYVGYFIFILVFLFNKNKKRKGKEKS